jgi:hypothetical protein
MKVPPSFAVSALAPLMTACSETIEAFGDMNPTL